MKKNDAPCWFGLAMLERVAQKWFLIELHAENGNLFVSHAIHNWNINILNWVLVFWMWAANSMVCDFNSCWSSLDKNQTNTQRHRKKSMLNLYSIVVNHRQLQSIYYSHWHSIARCVCLNAAFMCTTLAPDAINIVCAELFRGYIQIE